MVEATALTGHAVEAKESKDLRKRRLSSMDWQEEVGYNENWREPLPEK